MCWCRLGSKLESMPSKTYDKQQDRKNSESALERDEYICVWCKNVLGITSVGSVPHHIFGRRRNHSTDAQVTLCMVRSTPDNRGNDVGCHVRYEQAYLDGDSNIEITKDKLIRLMSDVYGIKLNEYY